MESQAVFQAKTQAKNVSIELPPRFLPDYFAEVFRWMPLAHVVQERVFVCHGGLSRQRNVTLMDIKQIK